MVGCDLFTDPGWQVNGLAGIIELYFSDYQTSVEPFKFIYQPPEIAMPEIIPNFTDDLRWR